MQRGLSDLFPVCNRTTSRGWGLTRLALEHFKLSLQTVHVVFDLGGPLPPRFCQLLPQPFVFLLCSCAALLGDMESPVDFCLPLQQLLARSRKLFKRERIQVCKVRTRPLKRPGLQSKMCRSRDEAE